MVVGRHLLNNGILFAMHGGIMEGRMLHPHCTCRMDRLSKCLVFLKLETVTRCINVTQRLLRTDRYNASSQANASLPL